MFLCMYYLGHTKTWPRVETVVRLALVLQGFGGLSYSAVYGSAVCKGTQKWNFLQEESIDCRVTVSKGRSVCAVCMCGERAQGKALL